MLLTVSRYSTSQWPWETVRALATGGQLVVTAEAAQYVSQHGHGLVKLPADMVQILDGYFKDAGLTGKTAKLRTRALTDQLKSLSRSSARGGLQPYRTPDTGTAATAAAKPSHVMTQQQLQEEQQMDEELSKFAQTFGPEIVEQHRAARERAAALAAIPIPRTRGGRIKTKAKSALLQHVSTNGFLTLPHEYVRAAFDLPPTSTLDDPDRNMEIKKLTPTYTASQTQAYALSRLPGCYAASRRIFRELAVRFPDLKPKSLLDFGAGPGTATWAAQEAWSSSLSRVLAVEPSPAMRQLGAQLEAARRFAHPRAPVVHWRSELPAPARSQRMRRQQACHDVVVASYVLGEVLDPQERRDLVRRLWGLTSGILVLVEPGTPAGAVNIQEARSAILQREARKTAKVQRKLTELQGATGSSGSEDADLNSSSRPDFNLHQKLSSKWYGAHIVAPCPHDGPCPLAAPGSKAWCHFGTRFQRPAHMQESKALKGTHVNPADHQDERYSYVVIRRGARPAAAPQVEISKAFMPKAQAATTTVTDPWDDSEDGGSILSVDPGKLQRWELAPSQRQEPALVTGHAAQLNPLGEVAPQLATQQSTGKTAASSTQISHAPLIQNSLVQAEEMQQLYALAGLAGPTRPQVEQPLGLQRLPATHLDADNHGPGHDDHFMRVNAKLDVYGQGFVNRLIASEDAGVDWAGGGDINLPSHLPPKVEEAGARDPAASLTKVLGSCAAKQISDSLKDTLHDRELEPAETLDSSVIISKEQALDGADVAAADSRSWSRLIRPPRKRGGHVILDVCTAGMSPDGRHDFDCGQLERHVVARSDAEKWMGMAAYSLVQHARWGDLWPSYYHRNPKKQVLRSAVESK